MVLIWKQYSIKKYNNVHDTCVLFLRDAARYDFTHEILALDVSKFRGNPVPRDRRISVICRNEPSATPEDQR